MGRHLVHFTLGFLMLCVYSPNPMEVLFIPKIHFIITFPIEALTNLYRDAHAGARRTEVEGKDMAPSAEIHCHCEPVGHCHD